MTHPPVLRHSRPVLHSTYRSTQGPRNRPRLSPKYQRNGVPISSLLVPIPMISSFLVPIPMISSFLVPIHGPGLIHSKLNKSYSHPNDPAPTPSTPTRKTNPIGRPRCINRHPTPLTVRAPVSTARLQQRGEPRAGPHQLLPSALRLLRPPALQPLHDPRVYPTPASSTTHTPTTTPVKHPETTQVGALGQASKAAPVGTAATPSQLTRDYTPSRQPQGALRGGRPVHFKGGIH